VSRAGLGALLKTAKQAKAALVGFVLAAPQPAVREVLEISGFAKSLGAYATREEAATGTG
jgi:anti-anti-sigma factor